MIKNWFKYNDVDTNFIKDFIITTIDLYNDSRMAK
jgi:hypothetical protein